KRPVEHRRNELFFRIRLWGRAEILDALFEVYDHLPEEVRAELPLRRTWMLVPEEEEPANATTPAVTPRTCAASSVACSTRSRTLRPTCARRLSGRWRRHESALRSFTARRLRAYRASFHLQPQETAHHATLLRFAKRVEAFLNGHDVCCRPTAQAKRRRPRGAAMATATARRRSLQRVAR